MSDLRHLSDDALERIASMISNPHTMQHKHNQRVINFVLKEQARRAGTVAVSIKVGR